jgi:DNA-binding XRE family transcriptional regulator
MTIYTAPLEVTAAVQRLGENIRLARIRRRLSQEELAQACGITRKTLYALEKGALGATIATAFTVLWKLGLLHTAAAIADRDTDEHGKILEAARQPKRVRQPVVSDNDF